MTAPLTVVQTGHNSLAELAHEINVRLQKADDHRLSAALKLAEAKAACKDAGMSFKEWVGREIQLGYGEAKKLAVIGSAPDPVKALQDHRQRVAARVRKTRAPGVLRNTPGPAALAPPARGKAVIITRVREAITALSGLPPADEVLGYLSGTDDAVIIGENLSAASRWLAEFSTLWPEESE
jgi:hypothetical protein